MNNTFSRRYLLVLCLLVGGFSNVIAGYDQECCVQAADCGNPLNCGAVIFEVQGGVAPTLWQNRGDISLITCNALAIPGNSSDFVTLVQLPKFNKLFRIPWIIGGHLGYALDQNIEVFAEVHYRQASSKQYTLNGLVIPNDVVNLTFKAAKYKAVDAFFGARYYWGDWCWCDQMSLFFGGQIGLLHRKTNNFDNFSVTSTLLPAVPGSALVLNGLPFYNRSTSFAGGANMGGYYCFGCGLQVGLLVEIIAACGPANNPNIVTPGFSRCAVLPSIAPSNTVIGGVGTELFFPVALSLRYAF